jgi:hypothetical protein
MTKIVVIEPHRILQQGIAIALYPENDVQLKNTVPENLASSDFDAAIVDAASLRESNALDAAALRAIQGWKLPTIWIDDQASGQVPYRGQVVTLQRPIGRQALVAALRECLGPASGAKGNAALAERSEDRRSSSKGAVQEITSGDAGRTEPIELTDIVEEPAGDKKIQTPQDKKK